MSDYKDTLNLPHTDFPMRANLANNEPKILKKWQDNKLYQIINTKNQSKKPFILHDGPPYANGDIHIGHAVNKILKDIIIKYKRLTGFNAPFIPGWDCHGLPIELNVEKKKGKVGHKINAKDFRKACREYADKQISAQRESFKRLGILADWDNPYLTKNYTYEADIIRALGLMIENRHLIAGAKPVHWCYDCASALAEAEVEYKQKSSDAIYVKFKLIDNIFKLDKPIFVVIWTTTPWTLPANEAVALNPNFDYVVLKYNNEYLLVAKDCVSNLPIKNPQLSAYHINGAQLDKLLLQHPFYHKQVPIILGEHVTTETGTGAVHTAPAHGQDDFAIGLQYKLPLTNLIADNGVFFDDVELVGTQFVLKANQIIINELKNHQTLLYCEQITHNYPHCWRHKTPLIFRATPQWFIAMDKYQLRTQALAAIKTVKWIPNWGEKRIQLMLENRPDWCISRQRTWGVPIALFVHKKTKRLHPNTKNLLKVVAQKVEKNGIDAWFDLAKEELLASDADDYEKITNTLDVWFDSGVSHFAVLSKHFELQKPADLYLEGSDQHRGWFQSSLLSSIAISGVAPYKQVLTHGFTVDAIGKKMSKSLGNIISPQKIAGELGADVLRLWVASSDYVGEMAVSHSILKSVSDSYRRLRNTMRFMLANMSGFLPSKHLLTAENMLDLDRYIVNKALNLQQQIIKHYNQYEFHQVVKKIVIFATNDLGGFYLDIIKDRQYTCKANSVARRSAQSALYLLSQILVRLIAPFLSFTAEEVWQYLPEQPENSIFLEDKFYKPTGDFTSNNSQKAFDYLSANIMPELKKHIEDLRAKKQIGSSLEVEIKLFCNTKTLNLIAPLKDELRFFFIVSTLKLLPSKTDKTQLKIQKTTHPKCIRCWHHRSDVGANKNHPQLCSRCVDNVDGDGEVRRFA